MKKNNEILSVGVSAVIIGFIFMSISFFTNERFISIISGVCAVAGLFFALAGKIIQKLDEVIEALSPKAAIEIDEALDRHRQWIEDAGKREVEWQSLQTDSTSYTGEDSSISFISTERKEKIDSLEQFRFQPIKPTQFAKEYTSTWGGDDIKETKIDVVATSTDRDPSLYWQPGQENW